jgi:hypothetical protein
MTFTDPAGIGHVANLTNLGGSSAVSSNQVALTYNLRTGTPATFTVDYQSAVGTAVGTYSGRIVINGKYNTKQTIKSTIVVNASPTPPAPLPSPSGGCEIEGTKLKGLSTAITSGVASITGKTTGSIVWGDNVYGYTSDSDFAKAAVHAGVLTDGQTGNVRFTNLRSKPGPFPGTTANGVTTTPWNNSWCTVTLALEAVAPIPTTTAAPVVTTTTAAPVVTTTPAPSTYTWGTYPTSINEGDLGTFNVNTTNVPNGTQLRWESINLSGSDAPVLTNQFAITSNTGSFTITITADNLTEGTENFAVEIYTLGGDLVLTSNTIAIVDSSISAIPLQTTTTTAPASDPRANWEPIYGLQEEVHQIVRWRDTVTGQIYNYDGTPYVPFDGNQAG